MSETSKVRHLVRQYCTGHGIDLGCGGDKITENCIGFDRKQPYINYKQSTIDAFGDATNLKRYKSGTFDFVYSSHLIEDFPRTEPVLREWLRVLKPGGHLILVFPDQRVYELHGGNNPHHRIPEMGLDYMIGQLDAILRNTYTVNFTSDCQIDYNVIIVITKLA